MKSKVYFCDAKSGHFKTIFDNINSTMRATDLSNIFHSNDHTAIKLSFGEWGNLNYIRPQYLVSIVEELKRLNVMPFLTDTNTLYKGMRTNSINHIKNAIMNGFGYETMQTPIIIADGIMGQNYVEVPVNGEILSKAKIASDIYYADSLLCVSHFKLHDLAGFGAAIKNLGMGCAAKAGKIEQHSDIKPSINMRCVRCGKCYRVCNAKAISITDKANIDPDKCLGCGLCELVCSHNAIKTNWDTTGSRFLYKLVEYAKAAVDNKQGRCLFINFMTNIAPVCDCVNYTPAPMMEDCGILMSEDPVACDKACVDIFIKNLEQQTHQLPYHKNVMKMLDSDETWHQQFEYAQKIGFGTTDYELVKINNDDKAIKINRLNSRINK